MGIVEAAIPIIGVVCTDIAITNRFVSKLARYHDITTMINTGKHCHFMSILTLSKVVGIVVFDG